MIYPQRILDCFGANFIGLRNCEDNASQSGYYINDEVNITLSGLAKIANGEDVKGAEMLNRIQRLAIVNTANDYLTYLERYAKMRPMNSTHEEFTITIPNNQVLRIKTNSEYKRINIVKKSSSEIMYLKDGDTTQTDVRYINHLAKNEVVYLYFDKEELTICDEISCKDNCSCCGSCRCFDYKLVDIPEREETGCNKVTFTCACNYEDVICSNKMLLSRAIYFHTVGLFFKEKWLTTNIDPYINNSKEQSKELYHEFLNGYEDKKSKYHDALKFAAQTININHRDGCFKCRGVRLKKLI